MIKPEQIECVEHGKATMTFVCEHLACEPHQTWHSLPPDSDDRWPDAWCSSCHANYQLENEWNEKNEGALTAKLICHRCYEASRALGTSVYVD